jgi:carbon monoxide dehydrogenase subunit G
MELTGSTSIRQPIEVVWSGLNNEEILRQCITGCESLERLDATSLVAKLAVKLGPVRAKFSGKINMSEVIPLQGYTLAFEGSGGAAGFAKGSSKVALQSNEAGTLVSYTAQASVGGKLGQVGGRMIDATARSMADEFFKAFTQTLEADRTRASDLKQKSAQAGIEVSTASSQGLPILASANAGNLAKPSPDLATVSARLGDRAPLASDRSKELPIAPRFAADGQRVYWFIAGMIAATVLILIGKHWL